MADFSGYLAADELYDGPFCVLSAVDARHQRRPLYEVLDHDPTRVDLLYFLARLHEHIRAHGTGHSEAIITTSQDAARAFVAQVDAAAVLVNASTRFVDGGEFGFGAEIGISTQKLHARGPMGLPELTSTKYVVIGDGHTR